MDKLCQPVSYCRLAIFSIRNTLAKKSPSVKHRCRVFNNLSFCTGDTGIAYTVASNLLAAGEITAKGVVLSLLIGGMFANAIFLLRSSIPNYMGIFGPKNGVLITVLSAAIWNGIIILFIVLLAVFW
jgi:hypothetical protein